MAASLRKYSEQYKLAVPRAQGYWCREIPFEQWLIDKIEALESFRKTAEQLNERLEPQVLAMRCALYDIAIKAAAVGHDEIAAIALSALRALRDKSELTKLKGDHDHTEHSAQISS